MYAGMCLLMSIRLTRFIPASWHAFGVVVGICAAYSYYLMVGSCQMTVVKFLYPKSVIRAGVGTISNDRH